MCKEYYKEQSISLLKIILGIIVGNFRLCETFSVKVL